MSLNLMFGDEYLQKRERGLSRVLEKYGAKTGRQERFFCKRCRCTTMKSSKSKEAPDFY